MTTTTPPRALAALLLVWIYACAVVRPVQANDSTITSTITSSTIVTTSTTTITLGQSTFASTETLTATTSIPAGASTTGMASGSNAGSGSGVYSGTQFQDAVLNSTNLYRKAYQADPLTWDDTLAQYAQKYAENCVWEHSGGQYGENLALNYANPTLAIDGWAGEEEKYNFGKGKFGEKTGHFTQLVWQGTQRVGCGAVNCDSDDAQGWLLVCEYDPPGNVIGAFKENVEKAGEEAGQLGLGAAAGGKLSGISRVLVALVGVSALASVCL